MKLRRSVLVSVAVSCAALGMLAVSARAAAPAGHFTNLGDGTVRDNLTGLVWQQGFSSATQNLGDSAAYCSTPTGPSGGGWRLPTVAELQTLVDETVMTPSIDSAYFPSTTPNWFWSSTPVPGSELDGWAVTFAGGGTGRAGGSFRCRARCVR